MANSDAIAQFLASLGFSKAGTAGTMGAFQAESGLNPNARNASSGATGIAQWLGGRLTALRNMASSMGVSETNLNAQLDYFRQEITSPQYSGLLHELQTTNNPQQAAVDFVNTFERPGPGGDPGAAGFAQTFYNGGVPGPSGTPATTDAGNTGGGGNSTQGLPTWVNVITPFGPLFTGKDPILPGANGLAQGMSAFVAEIGTIINAFLDLFKPSFWLRVGAFIFGVILLIGGFVTLKGSVT